MFFNSSEKFLQSSAVKRKLNSCSSSPIDVTLIVYQNDMGFWVKTNLERFAKYQTYSKLPSGCTPVNTLPVMSKVR